ncbi:MAG: hypothetical protein Q8P45_03575 [Candidatus Harrisonbacteria bacterium]|nr:hypothetical protein [Candidatus Harrisonbacteria bacterium]
MYLSIPVASAAFKQIPDTLSQGGNSIINLIQGIGNWIFAIFLVLAVIFLLLAAFKYLFSSGGDKAQEAHKMIMYAVVAVAVAVLAPIIVNVIEFFVKNNAL